MLSSLDRMTTDGHVSATDACVRRQPVHLCVAPCAAACRCCGNVSAGGLSLTAPFNAIFCRP